MNKWLSAYSIPVVSHAINQMIDEELKLDSEITQMELFDFWLFPG